MTWTVFFFGVDEVQKPTELPMAMARDALADDLARKDVERRVVVP